MFENFGEMTVLRRKLQDNQDFTNTCHHAGKNKIPDCKILRLSTKNTVNIEKSSRRI